MGKYMILDEETETHVKFKRKSNPFLPENYIVMRGWKVQGDTKCSSQYFNSVDEVTPLEIPDDVDVIVAHNAKFEMLYEKRFSAQALAKFFKRGGRFFCTQYAEYLLRGQQKKYHMVPLDEIVESYGGRKKIDGIKALWEAGVMTSEIDRGLLTDYLIGTEEEGRNSGDIGNTELVYLGQMKELEANGMLPMIKLRMDGLCCTTEMEWNGIQIDTTIARKNLAALQQEFDVAQAELDTYVSDMPEGLVFNWGSPVHASSIIFGGTIRYKKSAPYLDDTTGELARKKKVEKWPLFSGEPEDPRQLQHDVQRGLWFGEDVGGTINWQDTYKSGKKIGQGKYKNVTVPGEIKTKIQDFFHTLPGYTKPDVEWKTKNADGRGKPVYSTSSDVIERISKRGIPFLELMGRYQALDKEIGTYYVRFDPKKKKYVGMLTCVDPTNKLVHHKLNHTSTVTTRLSSSDPNFQNIPRGDKSRAKEMMVSRFTQAYCEAHGLPVPEIDDKTGKIKLGVCGELDYSQLEVVVQGLLSRDKNLVSDLQNRIDFHCKRVAAKYGCSYDEALIWCKDETHPEFGIWKPRRTGVKEFSFQRAYGAGAPAIADATGLDEQTVRDLIAAEDKMYPGIGKFNSSVEAEVNATAEPFNDAERGWRTFRRGTWQAPTGTIYSWRSWDAPAFLQRRGIRDSFKPPELKNYPVQGTGGEIVQMVLGYLWRWFVSTDNFNGMAYLTNTVHDCVWVDMHPAVVDVVVPGMKRLMEAVPQILKKHFNINCPVPFPVEAETGPNMLDLHHYA